ncbi:MAG: hypothetical protein ACFFCW_19105, partial [Candidatus Hodarchaeota archaeon]
WETYKIIYLSRLGNYVPGRFWFAANYYIFSRRANVASDKIGKSFIINISLLFLTGMICVFPVISLLPSSAQKLLFALPIVILVLIHPKVLNRVVDILSPREKQCENIQDGLAGLGYSIYIKVFFLYFVAWFIAAAIMYVVLLAFQPASFRLLPICLSASASSLMIGLLAIFAPAGLGVREGVGAIVLSQVTSMETAVLVMAVLRINQVLAELSCGTISAISIYREDRQRARAAAACAEPHQITPTQTMKKNITYIAEKVDG